MRDRDERVVKYENKILRDSIITASLNVIPSVGPYLSAAYNYRSEVQQQRILHFSEQLGEYFKNTTGKDIYFDYIQTEDFMDFFSLVIEKIKIIKSEEKINRFKEILINQIEWPYHSDFTSTFLDIAERINEDQVLILSEFRKVETGELHLKYIEKTDRGHIDGGDSSGKEEPLEYLDYTHFGIEESKYLFYLQDLIAKGLIYDDGQGRLRVGPFKIIRITPFGLEFLKFLGKRS